MNAVSSGSGVHFWPAALRLLVPSMLVAAYFTGYYVLVVPAEPLVRIRSGSTLTLKTGSPQPAYPLRFVDPPWAFHSIAATFFSPAWEIDRVIRPEVWPVRKVDPNP